MGQEIRTARVQAKAEYDQLQTIKKPLELFVARGGLSDPLVAAREEIAALARQLLDKVGSVEDPKDDHDVDLALATLAEPIHCHPNRPLSDPDNIVAQGADAYVMGYRLLARAVTAVPKLARTLGLSPEQLAALEGTARDNFSAAIDRIDDVRNNSVAVSDVYDSRLFREYPELSGKKLLDVVKAAIPIIERDGEHQTLVICSPGASRNLDDALESLGRLATDIEDGKSPRLHRSYERHGKMTDTKAARTWLFDEGSLARLLDRMMRAATNDKSGWIAG